MRKFDKKKLMIIGIIIIVAVIYIVVALLLGGKKENSNNYLMVDNYLLWQKSNNKWVQLKEEPKNFYDNVFTLYYGTEKINNVKVQNNKGNLYFFDNDYNQIEQDSRAISKDLNLKFADIEVVNAEESDSQYIDEAIVLAKAENVGHYTTKKITYDFDGDGTLETLYVSKNYVFDVVDYNFYSMFYMVKNNNVELIASSDMPYDFIEVLDIDNDNAYEVIMSYDVRDLPTFASCYQLYDYVNGKWQLIKKCS